MATAEAGVRVRNLADFNRIEQALVAAGTRKHLIPDTVVEARFERRRPPLEPTEGARALYRKAQSVLAEIGVKLDHSEGRMLAGSDASFAGESGKTPVVDSFGLAGNGFHSPEEEYVELDSIVPRVYLLARMIQEISKP